MKTDRYTIYVGLNDGDGKEQLYRTEEFEQVLYMVCRHYKVSFSINQMSGGYFHDDGLFVQEKTLQISLLGASKVAVDEISNDVCTFFNQEAVLVIHDVVESYLIKNELSVQTIPNK